LIDVARVRSQIPACQAAIYLNSGFAGPPPTPVVEAIQDRLREESEQGPTSPAVQAAGRQLAQRAREAVAGLLDVSADEICLTDNTTAGVNLVAFGLSWAAGDEVITFAPEHPAVTIPALFLERQYGVRAVILPLEPSESHDSILKKVEQALTARTRLITMSHVQFTSGLRMPLDGIRALTRERGVRILVDGAQAAGQLALNLRSLDVDYYALPGQKWLLGPQGTGALFVKQELIAGLEPRYVAMRSATYYPETGQMDVVTDSIQKLELATASPALRAGLCAAVGFAQQLGLPNVEARIESLATHAKAALSRVPGVTVVTPLDPAASVGLVTFRVDGVEGSAAMESLWRDHRIVARSVDPLHAVRISLHHFNTEDEIDVLVDAIRRLR
jgi:L-cysteine/cystine lyase